VTDSAGLDLDPDLPRRGLRQFALDHSNAPPAFDTWTALIIFGMVAPRAMRPEPIGRSRRSKSEPVSSPIVLTLRRRNRPQGQRTH